ncbi:hypothetical protein SH611_20605 [Geminicoccaceae bacterium 1502E]|nr:hypothetical protein [Geminicoccaceae bacterium 1502E]
MLRLPLRRRQRIATEEALATFLAAQAAFLSQKTVVEFCRARAGLNWNKLFLERAFVEAMERCRGEAFAAVLGDVAESCQVLFRHAGLAKTAAPERLGPPVRAALLGHPAPPGGWEVELDGLDARLARALLAAPRPVHMIACSGAPRVFEALPIRGAVREPDRELIENGLRFLLCRVYADMERELDTEALAGALERPGEPWQEL